MMSDLARPSRVPWADLPRAVSEVLEPHVGQIVASIIDQLPHDVPAYARPMEGAFGQAVRLGVEVALHRFVLDLPGRDEPALTDESRSVYVTLGQAELRRGRTLDALLAAYRSGARMFFRYASDVVGGSSLSSSVVVPLGESIFAYIEELSAASVSGYAEEQSARAGERDRRRAGLLQMLLEGRSDEATLRWAAVSADWSPPQRVVAVVIPADGSTGVRAALGADALVDLRESDALAVIPAPVGDSARRRVDRALASRGAVVGPDRLWTDAAGSMRLAMVAGAALSHGVDGRPIWVDEHRAEVAVHAEPELVADLARIRLAPLNGLSSRRRVALVETLGAWLRHRGERAPIAAELAVHPQTVGYRVSQLRALFGDVLDDPLARFELELVLRAGHR
jgi:hypothetical protein